jgi:2'-5' RNA ligase
MRLFIAVEVPEGIKEKMGVLASELPDDGLSKVKPENVHFTLKYLGEVEKAKIVEIKRILHRIEFSPFSVHLKGVGVFPNESYAHVVWAGAECDEMEELARRIHTSLVGLFEGEDFSAHLTLARVKRKMSFRDFLNEHKGEEFGKFKVDKFVLFESRLQQGGPEYRKLVEFGAKPG